MKMMYKNAGCVDVRQGLDTVEELVLIGHVIFRDSLIEEHRWISYYSMGIRRCDDLL